MSLKLSVRTPISSVPLQSGSISKLELTALEMYSFHKMCIRDRLKTYPLPVYEGESSDSANQSAYPMVFPEKLTVGLLEKHQQLSENAKVLE